MLEETKLDAGGSISLQGSALIPGVSVIEVRRFAHEWRHYVSDYQLRAPCPQTAKNGAFRYSCDGYRNLPVVGDDFGLSAPGDLLRTSHISSPQSFTMLRIDSDLVHHRIFDSEMLPGRLDFLAPGMSNPAIGAAIRQLAQLVVTPIDDPLEVESALYGLVGKVFSMLSANMKVAPDKSRICQQRARRIRDMIIEQPHKKWRLSDFSGEAGGLSHCRLDTSFREITGLPIIKFLHVVRIARAMDLIKLKRLTLSEVAQSVGYYDQAALTRHFRSVNGMTPGRFART